MSPTPNYGGYGPNGLGVKKYGSPYAPVGTSGPNSGFAASNDQPIDFQGGAGDPNTDPTVDPNIPIIFDPSDPSTWPYGGISVGLPSGQGGGGGISTSEGTQPPPPLPPPVYTGPGPGPTNGPTMSGNFPGVTRPPAGTPPTVPQAGGRTPPAYPSTGGYQVYLPPSFGGGGSGTGTTNPPPSTGGPTYSGGPPRSTPPAVPNWPSTGGPQVWGPPPTPTTGTASGTSTSGGGVTSPAPVTTPTQAPGRGSSSGTGASSPSYGGTPPYNPGMAGPLPYNFQPISDTPAPASVGRSAVPAQFSNSGFASQEGPPAGVQLSRPSGIGGWTSPGSPNYSGNVGGLAQTLGINSRLARILMGIGGL